MMVLPMHVGGDGASDGHEPGAGGDRREPAERDQPAHELVQAGAGSDGHQAAFAVEGSDPAERGHVEHASAGVLGRVAVASAEASSQPPAQ